MERGGLSNPGPPITMSRLVMSVGCHFACSSEYPLGYPRFPELFRIWQFTRISFQFRFVEDAVFLTVHVLALSGFWWCFVVRPLGFP